VEARLPEAPVPTELETRVRRALADALGEG
jgi:hypothetical protein